MKSIQYCAAVAAITVLLSFGHRTLAQVPGYQGKRMSAGYKVDLSLATAGRFNSNYKTCLISGGYSYSEYKDEKPSKVLLAFNASHNFVFDYIVKRNRVLSANIRYFKSALSYGSYNYHGFGYAYEYGLAQIKGIGVNVTYKLFRNNIAPVGKYFGYAIGFNSIKADMPLRIKPDSKEIKTSTYNLQMLVGKQRVFFDRLVLDIAGSLDMLGMIGIVNQDNAVSLDEESFKKGMQRRIYSRDFISFSLAAKYLF